MTLNSEMTNLMDKARINYHTTDKLSTSDLTALMDKPGINGPLGMTATTWTHTAGWASSVQIVVPVYQDVPICATVELKGITSKIENQGPEIMMTYLDKSGKDISYWDKDSDGNYKPASESVAMKGSNFNNKDGIRTGYMVFDQSNISNVAYLRITVANNCDIEYDLRNLIVSYYKPYTYADLMGGGS